MKLFKGNTMKKALSMLLTCVLSVTLFSTAIAEEKILERSEIPLAEAEAQGLVRLGILKGNENSELELDRSLTRAEAVALIDRTVQPSSAAESAPMFVDTVNHWAQDVINKFAQAGYISGTSETTFEPERTVTGKEFARILLMVLGYTDATTDNAYERGIETGLLFDNFTKSVVYGSGDQEESLLRSDAARLCIAALNTKKPNGTLLYKELIERGCYKQTDFEDVLYSVCGVPDALSATSTFADKLNAQMPSDQNYMFSPLSIKLAFAMAANGAEGETQKEILDTLGIDNMERFNALSQEMIEKYQKAEILQLNIANAVWINKSKTDQTFSSAYTDSIKKFYQGTAETVTDEDAVRRINFWIKEKTNEKIPTIIDDSNFWAFLVNAVYFKGAWLNEFSESATAPDDFTQRGGAVRQTDFMHRTGWMNYYGDSQLQAVELPYRNRLEKIDDNGQYIGSEQYDDLNLSMFILMTGEKIADPEKVLTRLLERKAFDNIYVDLSMPRFKTEFSTGLNDMMKALGVEKAFTEDAEFSRMFDAGNMWITDTIHKTYISVDEKGTEAAAVTGMAMAGSSLPPEPTIMKANRPFTYLIRDNTSGEILFLGEYAFVE